LFNKKKSENKIKKEKEMRKLFAIVLLSAVAVSMGCSPRARTARNDNAPKDQPKQQVDVVPEVQKQPVVPEPTVVEEDETNYSDRVVASKILTINSQDCTVAELQEGTEIFCPVLDLSSSEAASIERLQLETTPELKSEKAKIKFVLVATTTNSAEVLSWAKVSGRVKEIESDIESVREFSVNFKKLERAYVKVVNKAFKVAGEEARVVVKLEARIEVGSGDEKSREVATWTLQLAQNEEAAQE
jgi:hypothetical protein